MTALSADRPSFDPKADLFGHAPFAQSLADSICRYSSDEGLVLALYGPWGSGKSTVLCYVSHYLEQLPDLERPVIVTFNPWWFSGQENLARAFLGQLRAVLPSKSEKFKKLGDLLGDFAEGVGGLIDLSGMTGGAAGMFGKIIGSLAKRKPKDVPSLKLEISKILRAAGKRILIVIDDIDRLTPDETRQLFTVIKGLADFPNVIYLLAFDREVAAEAIEQQSGLPGERYLEKIIQVPFELPPVDRVALRSALFKRLDEVLTETPEGLFDQSYWINVYFDGIDPLIQVPRDVVRFTNTLAVTYPSVRGEVNPVDFIALEALRVFLPGLYNEIRTNPDKFTGHRSLERQGTQSEEARKKFQLAWLQEIPEELKSSTLDLVQRIFPKLDQSIYGPDWLKQWRKSLRACHPDLFPIYFRLSVPLGAIRRSEMLAVLRLAETPAALGEILVHAAHERRPDGLSKGRVLLERLMDHVEEDIPAEHIPAFIDVLLNIGDELLVESDEQGFFDFGNESRVARIVYHLLKRLDKAARSLVLIKSISCGAGIGVQRYLLSSLLEGLKKSEGGGEESLIDRQSFNDAKAVWLESVSEKARSGELLKHSQLARLLAFWNKWGEPKDIRDWCQSVTASDDGLCAFLPPFSYRTKSQALGDWAVRTKVRLNPKLLEKYIDVAECSKRLFELQKKGKIPDYAQVAVSQFLKEYEALAAGKDPDEVFDD